MVRCVLVKKGMTACVMVCVALRALLDHGSLALQNKGTLYTACFHDRGSSLELVGLHVLLQQLFDAAGTVEALEEWSVASQSVQD